MPAEVVRGALLTATGIGTVFAVLVILMVVILLLGRLFPLRPKAEEAAPGAVPEGDREREIAAAIAVALSLAQDSSSPPATPLRATEGLRPWVAYGRQSLMSRREGRQGRWPESSR